MSGNEGSKEIIWLLTCNIHTVCYSIFNNHNNNSNHNHNNNSNEYKTNDDIDYNK